MKPPLNRRFSTGRWARPQTFSEHQITITEVRCATGGQGLATGFQFHETSGQVLSYIRSFDLSRPNEWPNGLRGEPVGTAHRVRFSNFSQQPMEAPRPPPPQARATEPKPAPAPEDPNDLIQPRPGYSRAHLIQRFPALGGLTVT